MNFDDEKLNNQDEKQSITWDELLSDDNLDLASLAKKSPDFSADDLEDLVNSDDELDLLDEQVDAKSISDLIEEEEEEVIPEPKPTAAAARKPVSTGLKYEEKKKSNSALAIAGVLAAAFLLCGLFAFAYFNGMTPFSKANTDTLLQESELGLVQPQEEPGEMPGELPQAVPSSDDVAAKPADTAKKDDSAKAVQKEAEKDTKKVTVAIGDVGRLDPFMPYEGYNLLAASPDLLPVLMPPEDLGSMPEAQALLKTTVSGILFDETRPSAIINVNGVDHFVQKGDRLSNLLVLDISRNAVTVRNGNNIYKAGVGELIDGKDVNYTGVYNLNKKFGGQSAQRNGYISSNEIQVNVKKQ